MPDTPGTINFPAALDTAVSLIETANNAATVLTAPASSIDTTLSVVSTSEFPSSGALTVNGEIVYYTGKTSTTVTGCLRGQNGTTPAAHASASSVEMLIISAHHSTLANALLAVQTQLGLEASYGGFGAAFTNLISNPSFEGGSTSSWVTSGTNTIAADTAQSLHGNYSLKATYSNDLRLAAQSVVLSATTAYVFYAYIYIPSDWDGGQIRIGDDGTYAGATSLSYNADMTLVGQWQRVTMLLTTAADASGSLVIQASSAPTAGKFIYIDNVQVTAGTKPLPFSSLSSLVPKGLSVAGNLTVMGIGNSSFAGNVGIGTPSPDAPLTINVNGNVNSILRNTAAASTSNVARLDFYMKNSAGTDKGYANIKVISSAITNSAEETAIRFSTYSNGGITDDRLTIKGNLVGVGSTAPTSKLFVAGAIGTAVTSVTGTTTLDATHSVVLVNGTGITINLPTAVGISGRQYIIKNSSANAVTIDPSGSETVDGVATYSLPNQYNVVRLISDGANWIVA